MRRICPIIVACLMVCLMALPVGAKEYVFGKDTFAKQGPGALGFGDEEKQITYSQSVSPDAQSVWAGIETVEPFDLSNGVSVEISDIRWSPDDNAVIVIVIGDPVGGRTWVTAKHGMTMTVGKDGNAVFWGIGNENYFGATGTVKVKIGDEGLTSFMYTVTPGAGYGEWVIAVNGQPVMTYHQDNKSGWPGCLASMSEKHMGFGVLDGDDFAATTVPGDISFKVSTIKTPGRVTVNGEAVAFAYPGENVSVDASEFGDTGFVKWASGNVAIEKDTDPVLSFVMPEENVELVAEYEKPAETTTDNVVSTVPDTESDNPSTSGPAKSDDSTSSSGNTDSKNKLHPAIIVVIAVAVVAVIVVIISVAAGKKKKINEK